MKEENQDIKTEESQDTISQLLDNRDWENCDQNDLGRGSSNHPKAEDQDKEKSLAQVEDAPKPNAPEATPKEQEKPVANKTTPERDSKGEIPSQLDLLRKKLEKTEKILADNQRYGRNNAQKVKAALKAAQKLTEDGLLDEDEVKELLATLQSEEEEDDGIYPHSSPANLFAPVFKVANKELENIRKYTDDPLLQDKVEAFDYFLSVSSKEEREQVLDDLTELLGNPVKLAKKMLSIGQEVFDESYKAIKESGGFKNYLSKKDQEIEKLQKNLDKLEKKLLQYEDFDKPRYRIDETGSLGMGDVESEKPANDTISALFDERDKVRRKA